MTAALVRLTKQAMHEHVMRLLNEYDITFSWVQARDRRSVHF
jgi:hypothetical protein